MATSGRMKSRRDLVGLYRRSLKTLRKKYTFFDGFNPLHLNLSMHILPTIPYTFPKVLNRRIC